MQGLSVPSFNDWRSRSTTLDALGAYLPHPRSMIGNVATSTPLRTADVSADLFRVLGTRALLGRTFTTADLDIDPHVVVLGYNLWRDTFGGRRSILGSRLTLTDTYRGGTEYATVVAVMPPSFSILSSDA